jgi:uncharacterized protein (DUF1778 family)
MAPAKKPRSKTAPERTATGFRVSVEQLERIDARARAAGLSRTEYIIAAALDELPDKKNGALNRIEAIERRLDRLEVTAGYG